MYFDKLFKLHSRIIICSPFVGAMLFHNENPQYSFRRNCFYGSIEGLLIGLSWPVTFPIITYLYVKDVVDSDPIIPEEKLRGKYEERYGEKEKEK